ncbi:MAG: NAD(P)-dependent alcohol dehydrogenase [Alphaproteobacteria bacterium]|jgi:NADPH:quinone reductase-like Zn-dependent oxidoreductase|nr:NAD(P)-dependent alcohol dehydrogenase [Alphaproteobacteria bacterium]MDP6516420.1 NAD(P)-dependent alcohol dehydrogenase [Alphaproteobacteria bacterium]
MKAYEIRSADGIDALALADRAEPKPGPGQVLVRMHANAINYRDLVTVENPAPRGFPFPRIPNSDGAGEVTALGAGASRFEVGDRVMGSFFQRWIAGEITADAMVSALGGALDGMLAEEVVLDEDGLVAVPGHLTYAEAATLPCAALTAWHALVARGGVTAGDVVLLLGTGGVSIFALQFARAHGARVIITSSSDAKLARAKDMGAWGTVNYKTTPDWEKAVLDLTGGRGADHVVEVGGAGTLARSIEAARFGGSIYLIGILSRGELNPTAIMRRSLNLHGIYVGSRAMFEAMNRAIEVAELRPVIDKEFAFTDARAAYHALRGAGHFGKLVITFDG